MIFKDKNFLIIHLIILYWDLDIGARVAFVDNHTRESLSFISFNLVFGRAAVVINRIFASIVVTNGGV